MATILMMTDIDIQVRQVHQVRHVCQVYKLQTVTFITTVVTTYPIPFPLGDTSAIVNFSLEDRFSFFCDDSDSSSFIKDT